MPWSVEGVLGRDALEDADVVERRVAATPRFPQGFVGGRHEYDRQEEGAVGVGAVHDAREAAESRGCAGR